MAISRVQLVGTNSAATSGNTIAVTLSGISTAAGNHLIVVVGYSGSSSQSASSCADTQGNTYQKDADVNNGGSTGTSVALFSCKQATGLVNGNTITVTLSASVTYRSIVVYEYSGLDPTTWFSTSSSSKSSTNSATVAVSSPDISISVGDLLIQGLTLGSATANLYTATSGSETLLQQLNYSAKTTYYGEYIATSASSTYHAGGTLSSSTRYVNLLARYLAASGTQYTQSVSGGLSFSGAQAKQSGKPLSGTLSFVGGQARSITRALSAVLTPAGILARRTSRSLSGGLSFVGGVVGSHLFTKTLTATLSFAGSQTRQAQRALAGGLSFVGSQSRGIAHILSANLSPAGALSRFSSRSLSASLTPTGALQRLTSRALAAGAGFVGGLNAVKNAGGQLYTQSMTAALSFAGGVSRGTDRALTASLALTGSVARQTRRTLVASVGFVGAVAGQLVGAAIAGLAAVTDAARWLMSLGESTPHVAAATHEATYMATVSDSQG